jgi:glycosyltransferase involved in cell wall biosynthesis
MRVRDRVKKLKVAMYTPFLYPWMLDLSCEISKRVKAMRYYTTGIYGNYSWKEYEKYTYTFRRHRLFSEIIVRPKLFTSYIRYRPNLIILFATEMLVPLLLYVLSKIIGTEVILVVEENKERFFSSFLMKNLARLKGFLIDFVHKDAKVIVAESEASKKYLLLKGYSDEKIHVIPHGVNTGYFSPKPKSKEFAEQIGLSAKDLQKTIVLFTGEFSEAKGAEYTVETIFELSNNNNILFLVPAFGQVFFKYKEKLERKKNVRNYPKLSFIDMPDLYSLADMVIVPSKFYRDRSSDRSPNCLIEGMACGKAVIGSDVGGIPTIMDDAGVLISPNDSNSLTNAILGLASNESLMRELGKKTRERAITMLNNKIYASKILELYKNEITN